MFGKRGISPLIATVLIIGFTIAIAAIIILWGGGFIRGMQLKSDVSAAKAETCAATLVRTGEVQQNTPSTVDFLLENKGGVDVESVIVRVTGKSGIESVVVNRGVKSSAKKNFHVNFDPGQVGVVSNIEILPVVPVAGKEEPCANGIGADVPKPSDYELSQWDAACGNNVLDLEWEECDRKLDGSLLLPESPFDGLPVDCASFGYPSGGSLACSEFCTIDISGCTVGDAVSSCGNGVLDGEEGCDISLEGLPLFVNGITDCASLSQALGEPTVWSGDLYCTPECLIDVSQCFGGSEIPESCGDGFVDSGEECDQSDLSGQTCVSQGFSGDRGSGSGVRGPAPPPTGGSGSGERGSTPPPTGGSGSGERPADGSYTPSGGSGLGCNADCTFNTDGCI